MFVYIQPLRPQRLRDSPVTPQEVRHPGRWILWVQPRTNHLELCCVQPNYLGDFLTGWCCPVCSINQVRRTVALLVMWMTEGGVLQTARAIAKKAGGEAKIIPGKIGH
jgi:hypothetical protein